MSINADLIIISQALLAGRHMTPEEAETKAKLLCSREEYVATLFIGAHVFSPGSPATQALFASAKRHYVEPRTPRPKTADIAGAIAARRRAREAIAALISSDQANETATKAVAEDMLALARREAVGPGHPGFRWRIKL